MTSQSKKAKGSAACAAAARKATARSGARAAIALAALAMAWELGGEEGDGDPSLLVGSCVYSAPVGWLALSSGAGCCVQRAGDEGRVGGEEQASSACVTSVNRQAGERGGREGFFPFRWVAAVPEPEVGTVHTQLRGGGGHRPHH